MSQSHPAVLTQTESDPGGVAVRVRKLTKHFGAGDQRVQALAGINLDIYAGQMSLIVGPSGCGKTTVLRTLNRIARAYGVTEAAKPEVDEEFGDERLADLIRQHAGESAEAMVQAVIDSVSQFTEGAPPADDITVVIAKRN